MECRKCHSEIPDNSRFCPNCGTDLTKKVKKSVQPQDTTIFELITKFIGKHKKGTVSVIATIIIAVVAFSYISTRIEKEKSKAEFMQKIQHLDNIVGTYSGGYDGYYKLELGYDNKANLTVDNFPHLGYWEEKVEGAPLTIEFSESFKINLGSGEEYHSILYFYQDRLWESLSAIKSYDTSKSIKMNKINQK